MNLEEKIKECKTPLDYSGFEKYYYIDPNLVKQKDFWELGKHQWLFKFDNGYGASVVKHFGSYGFEDDLFELAVIKFDMPSKLYGGWHLNYNTPITNNVIGYLTNNDVLRYLIKIQRLDKNGR